MPVLEEFRQAINVQQIKDDEAFEEQIDLPLDERIAKGITMKNLKVVFSFYDEVPNQYCPRIDYPLKFIRTAKVYCENNISKFRVGAQVRISNEEYDFKMDIIEDSVKNFEIAPNDYDVSSCYIDSENYNPNNWEINIVKSDLNLRLLTATASNLANDQNRLNKIEVLLAGVLSNNYTSNKYYTKLNESQNTAITKALLSPNFHLIQGPPGTGKTKTIAHIAKVYLDAGKKVFVTAPTHTAINNCLNAISEVVQDKSKIVKIGEKYQAEEILGNDYVTRKTRLSYEKYLASQDISQHGILMGGTPYSMCYPASRRIGNLI